MKSKRKILATVVVVALVLLAAGGILAVLYGGADSALAAGAQNTVTTICDPAACPQQGVFAGQGSATGTCPGYADDDGDGVCDYRGTGVNAGSCPAAAGAQNGTRAGYGPGAGGGWCGGGCGR